MTRAAVRTFIALALSLPLAATPAAATLIFDPADPAFAGAVVVPLDQSLGLVDGMTGLETSRGGVALSFATASPGGFATCSQGTCQFVSYREGVTIQFDPPVAAAGFQFLSAECVGRAVFTGTGGGETFSTAFGAFGIFIGAANLGCIEQVELSDPCFAAWWRELRFVPSAAGSCAPPAEAADLRPAKTGPAVASALGNPHAYGLELDNEGPGTALDARLVDFLPPALLYADAFPATTLAAGGRVATLHFGDLAAGTGGSGFLSFDLPPFSAPPGEPRFGCRDLLLNAALSTSASLETNPGNDLVHATTWFDEATRAGTGEVCGNGIDDNCDGRADCQDATCNCYPQLSGSPPACTGGSQAPLPLEVALPFGLCSAADNPAAERSCSISRGACGTVQVPAHCCDPLPPDPTMAGYERLDTCDLTVDGCVPIDPNHKQAVPNVNSAGHGYTRAGAEIRYHVTYENIGGADAHDVAILDPLSLDLDETTLVVDDGGVYDPAGRTLVWRDPLLPPHQPRQVGFRARVRADAPAGTRVRNVATVLFPDAVPPSRVDTAPVEHTVLGPAMRVEPELAVLRCVPLAQPGRWRVDLVNRGYGFAYNVVATLIDPPPAVVVSDAEARFAHPDDADPSQLRTVLPLAVTSSLDDLELRTETPGDPCPALRFRLRWETLGAVASIAEVQSRPDADRDAVADDSDNCPAAYNPSQADADRDGSGDACDSGGPAEPLDCSNAAPSLARLWPPNHKLVPVAVGGVVDAQGAPAAITVDSVFQDEPTLDQGSGQDCPDAAGLGAASVLLRAERSGGRDGRVYHVGFTARAGTAACRGEVAVCVPHEAGGSCGDQGALENSGVCSGRQ